MKASRLKWFGGSLGEVVRKATAQVPLILLAGCLASTRASATVVFLTTSATWTVPAGVTAVQVECIGAGGNGITASGGAGLPQI